MTRSTRLFSTTTAELPALLFRSHAKNFAALGGAEPVKHHRNAVKLCKKKHERLIQIPKHGFCFAVLVGSPCFRQRTRHRCLPSWPAFLILPLCVLFSLVVGSFSFQDCCRMLPRRVTQFVPSFLSPCLFPFLSRLCLSCAPWPCLVLDAAFVFWCFVPVVRPFLVPFLSPSSLLLVSFLPPSCASYLLLCYWVLQPPSHCCGRSSP